MRVAAANGIPSLVGLAVIDIVEGQLNMHSFISI